MSRHQTSIDADRLQTVRDYLAEKGIRGATSRDILIDCNINRASDAIYDLRNPAGDTAPVAIVGAWETSSRGKPCKRYWLAEHAPAEVAA